MWMESERVALVARLPVLTSEFPNQSLQRTRPAAAVCGQLIVTLGGPGR